MTETVDEIRARYKQLPDGTVFLLKDSENNPFRHPLKLTLRWIEYGNRQRQMLFQDDTGRNWQHDPAFVELHYAQAHAGTRVP